MSQKEAFTNHNHIFTVVLQRFLSPSPSLSQWLKKDDDDDGDSQISQNRNKIRTKIMKNTIGETVPFCTLYSVFEIFTPPAEPNLVNNISGCF
ncbi:hypothetical protein RIF29_28102 [Crotalaria pallida]|uniref:Uncharacterized protein n=1 Tax=Crotalaria pallida TaxID=3830 RepID=A0AAN9EXR2_CROPI